MNWINKWKLPVIETIKYDNHSCLSLNSLWNALHSSFNTALHQQVNINILDKIRNKQVTTWALFSKEEFEIAISSCNNLSTPGLDKLLWSHLKFVLKHDVCLTNIIKIANTCIDLGYWPNYFKRSLIIIIPKPNKTLCKSPKLFRPIILFNTLGKLIEKVIGERIQFHVVTNDFIYSSQLEGLKFKSTTDASVALTHIICSYWTKNSSTSILAFNILQFFPSLNHQLLTWIIHKVGLDIWVVNFFSNYLVDRKTNYLWNNFSSLIFSINVGVGQGLALSPILSALYLSLFLYISQNKSFETSNFYFFCSYNVMTKLLDKFRLVVEHSKTKIFHFSRLHGSFNPPFLDLSPLGGLILTPKNSWKYLGFIFDRKLIFHQHINFYSNKVLSSVKCMKLLGNSSYSITPLQKWLLYRYCVLPITLYGF